LKLNRNLLLVVGLLLVAAATLAALWFNQPAPVPRTIAGVAVAATTCPTYRFRDVAADSKYYTATQYVVCHGIMTATLNADGSYDFDPDRITRRDEFTAVLQRAYNIPIYSPADNTFYDVPASDPYFVAIESGVRDGVLTGYIPVRCVMAATPVPSKPCFRPSWEVTRGQTERVIKKARGYADQLPPQRVYADISPGKTWYTDTYSLAPLGIFEGGPCPTPIPGRVDRCFLPHAPISKADFALFVVRSFNTLALPFDFERGPQGWWVLDEATGAALPTYTPLTAVSFTTTSALKFAGERALQISVAGGGSELLIVGVPVVAASGVLTAEVSVAAGDGGTSSAVLEVLEGGRSHRSPAATLKPGQWSTLNLTLPSGYQSPYSLRLRLSRSNPTAPSTFYVDQVEWPR